MTLYQNEFRVESTRLREYDYSSSGAYFVTVCTKNHEALFGSIINGSMVFSEIGVLVKKEWEKSFEIRLELFGDEYVIMPNHVHGIVVIDRDRGLRDARRAYGDACHASLHHQPTPHGVAVRTPRSLSSFVAGFKSAVTRRIDENLKTPNRSIWQSRFFERVIRNDDEMNRIRQYIMNNPAKWQEDKYNNCRDARRASHEEHQSVLPV